MTGPRILVVDDHPDTLHLYETCLTLCGFHVTTADNATDAMERASKSTDAIVTDLAMPGIDGVEFIRTMRERSAVPIVAVTGQAIDCSTITRGDIDCCRLLQKPCDIEQLAGTLRFLIHACVRDCTICPHRVERIALEPVRR